MMIEINREFNGCTGCKHGELSATEYPCSCCIGTAEEFEEKLTRMNFYNPAKSNKADNKSNNVIHPKHYNSKNRKECWDEMIEIFGADAVAIFDCLSVYKYDYRKGNKDGNPTEQDIAKINNYITHAESFDKLSAYAKYVLSKIKEVIHE